MTEAKNEILKIDASDVGSAGQQGVVSVTVEKAGRIDVAFEANGKHKAPLEIQITPWPSTHMQNIIFQPLEGVKINKQTPEEEVVRAWPGLVVDPQGKGIHVIFPESLVKTINSGIIIKFRENVVDAVEKAKGK